MPKKHKILKFKKELGFITTPERSLLMSKIGSFDTKPEILLRKLLFKNGIRYFKNYKVLPGTPDIVIKKHKIVVFVDGEFWHGYNWTEKKKRIKSNREFWIPKIERNMQRDKENNKALKKAGYNVIRFWEADIKKDIELCFNIIMDRINS